MAKRISDVERITAYFQSADESAATVMFQVIKGIMETRFKKELKKRGPNKPKGAQVSSPKIPTGTQTPENGSIQTE